VIDGLPLDARSRRAVDETLADWAHEEHEEPDGAHRTIVGLRGALSLVRVTAMGVFRDAIDFSWCRGLGSRAAWVLAGVGILAGLITVPGVSVVGGWAPVVGAVLALNLAANFLPVIVFLIFAWRPSAREVPRAGAALAIATIVLVVTAGILPPLNRFIQVVLDVLVTASADETGVRVAVSAAPIPGLATMAVLGAVCLIGATVLLASTVAQRSPLTSWSWLVGAPVAYVVGMVVLTMAYGLPLLLVFHLGDRTGGDVIAKCLGVWTAAVLVLAVAVSRAPRVAAGNAA
jgi:hypothetical protein